MTMRLPGPRSRLSWARGYRMPSGSSVTLRERRLPVLVNTIGWGPTVQRDQLDPERRRRFDIQLAAFLAAEELTHFTGLAAKYGMEHEDTGAYARWAAIRQIWHRQLGLNDERTQP